MAESSYVCVSVNKQTTSGRPWIIIVCAQSRAQAVEFHVPCHSELLCTSLRCSALLCASLCPMIASTPGLAECEKRFNTLPPSAGIKSMWLKTHTCVFSSTNRQQQDGPGSSSCVHNHEHKLSNSMCLTMRSCSALLCAALHCSVLRCAP